MNDTLWRLLDVIHEKIEAAQSIATAAGHYDASAIQEALRIAADRVGDARTVAYDLDAEKRAT